MEKLAWYLYEWVYDTILLRLIPYRLVMLRAAEALKAKPGGHYLDAGCGTGNFLAIMDELGGEMTLTGVDNSTGMLKRAWKKSRRGKLRAELVQADLGKILPFETSSFDGIVSINVLYTLEHPKFMLRECFRLLKKEGRLVLVSPINNPAMTPIIGEHLEALKTRYPKTWALVFGGFFLAVLVPSLVVLLVNLFIKTNKNYFFFKEQEIRGLLEENGFAIEQVVPVYGKQNWLVVAEKNIVNSSNGLTAMEG